MFVSEVFQSADIPEEFKSQLQGKFFERNAPLTSLADCVPSGEGVRCPAGPSNAKEAEGEQCDAGEQDGGHEDGTPSGAC